MRRFFSPRVTLTLLVIVGSLLPARPVRADGAAHEKVLPSTAWVVAADGKLLTCGTGCLVDREQRLLVTCLHVIKDETKATVFFPIFRQRGPVVSEAKDYLDRRTGINARVVATDSRRDLAFLRLDHVPSEVTSVEFAEQAPSPGEIVYGVFNSGNDGKPAEEFSLWKPYKSKFSRRVFSTQMIKNTGRTMDTWAVELDTPVTVGGSGGPVIDGEGRLLGIVYGMDENRSYAVDVEEVRLLLDRAKKSVDPIGSWTVRFGVNDKQPAYLKVNFLEGGELEWISDKKHVGRFELQEEHLTLIVPTLNIHETVSIIRRDEASFSFQSANIPFTFVRR